MRRLAALAAALLAVGAASPAGARLLLQDQEVQVSMPGELRCGEPARIEVVSPYPDLFVGDSPRLQALLDATRAMLGYECRDIPEIEVTGRVQGSLQDRYQGSASDATRWRLASRGGFAATPAPAPPPAPAPRAAARYSIRDVSTGMTPDDALRQARLSFDVEPSYDAKRREMAVMRGSCQIAESATPRPGWLCMRTLFTAGNDPRAYRVNYAQVVDQDQAEAIASQLERRFGQPVVDEQLRTSNWLRGGSPERHLAWGSATDGADGQRRHELEARIRVDGGATVLTLDLVDPGLSSEAPRFQVQF
jgi:hypothetical protein